MNKIFFGAFYFIEQENYNINESLKYKKLNNLSSKLNIKPLKENFNFVIGNDIKPVYSNITKVEGGILIEDVLKLMDDTIDKIYQMNKI